MVCALHVGAMMFAFAAQPLAAQSVETQAIKDATLVDIPFVLGDIDRGSVAGELWTTGDKPANTLLARFTVRPVQVAAMGAGAPKAGDPLLWRAFPGGGITVLRAGDLHLTEAPFYFCGPEAGHRAPVCYIDEDGDGLFDHAADTMPERGPRPYHVTIIKQVKPLDPPKPYHILADADRPAIPIELTNCARDYDHPRYTALSKVDRDIPVTPMAWGWAAKDSSFASCRRGDRLQNTSADAAPKGGYVAQIGPLAFAVGRKFDARMTLVGAADPDALYRIEGASLVDMRVGHTPNQAQLIARKKYPYPVLMADDGGRLNGGSLAKGAVLATIPFHHAYRGQLTQDVVITTLLGKRSVTAGTVVYGFPAQSHISRTVRGIPEGQAFGDDEFRKVNLEITWCAPVHDADPRADKPNAVGKGGWSATCIPHSMLGNHTIINGLQPAFAAASVSYDLTTSSNEGAPPIRPADESHFDRPLRVEYVYEGHDGDGIALSERIYFGDDLTSVAQKRIYAPSGTMIVDVAGMRAELTANAAGDLLVKPTGSPVSGANPIMKWDERPEMMREFQKLGLKMTPPPPQEDDLTAATENP